MADSLMLRSAEEQLQEAVAAFDFIGSLQSVQRYGEGHINDTFLVETVNEGAVNRYILQRINTNIFRDPESLIENIRQVTEHLKMVIQQTGGDIRRETLNLILTKEGKAYYIDVANGYWRSYLFVENSFCFQRVDRPELFYTCAETFGRFARQMEGYPAAQLIETIKNFHNTRSRFADFRTALQKDTFDRAKEVQPEIAFVLEREEICSHLIRQLEEGILPLRVTHNDTKLNNILIDSETGKALCVIDLDTVMPGLYAYDFGDSIRFGANNSAEDERDLSKVNFSLPLFETYTKGYLNAVRGAITDAEIDSLRWGARLMTLECGMRFLADYLEGDIYFKIHRPGHNLDRCRTQFKLVSDMEQHWDEMQEIVDRYR